MTGIGIGAGLGVLAGGRLSYSPLTLSTRLNQTGQGDNEWVQFGTGAPFHINATLPKTIGGWYKSTPGSLVLQTLMSKYDSLAVSGWRFLIYSDDTWIFQIRSAAAKVIGRRLDAPTGVDGAWHSAIATYDGSQSPAGISIYIDGLAPAATTSQTGTPVNHVTAAQYNVGNRADGGMAVDDFMGYVCHPFIIAEELTPAEALLIGGQGVPLHLINALPTRTIEHWCAFGDGCALGASGYVDISGGGNHGTTFNVDAGDIQGDVPP